MSAMRIVRGSSAALYPFTQTYVCNTGTSNAQNGSTTRWPKSPPIVKFTLPYNPLSQTDKNNLKNDFTSAKGEFTTNLSVTTDITYTNLSFDVDEFTTTEQVSTIYGVQWALTQSLPQNFTPGASGSAFPTLASGRIGQIPYTQKKRFKTIASKMDAGPKYAFSEYGAGLTNFPTDGLMGWEFGNPSLSDADTATIIAHFLANWGDCFGFNFTDEDSVTYSKVHYASPQLVVNRLQKDQSSVHIALAQYL